MSKLNCWEFKKCGREVGGSKTAELGVCPTSSDNRLNGVHGGTNAGRACWVMDSTLCDGKIQGGFKEKYKECFNCEFYKLIVQEEASYIQYEFLLKKLHHGKINAADIIIGQPIEWDCFDSNGILLLQKGQIIESMIQLSALLDRGLFYHKKKDEGQSSRPAVARIQSPFDLLNEMQNELAAMFTTVTESTGDNFRDTVLQLCGKIQQACEQDADASIGNIFLNNEYEYTIRHPVNVAIICELIAQKLTWVKDERLQLLAAALTMNIGMLKIQETLHHQKEKKTDEQARLIHEHPERGAKMLSQAGVSNKVWIEGVLYHHEAMDGSGYAAGLSADMIPPCARIISFGDQYCAAVSSRSYRRSLTSQESMRDIYLKAGQKTDKDIANLCVRLLGVYPPGTFVKLANGEIAVVTHRGEKAHAPIARSVVRSNKKDISMKPVQRDCSTEEYAIQGMAYEEQKMTGINPNQLWGYLDT